MKLKQKQWTLNSVVLVLLIIDLMIWFHFLKLILECPPVAQPVETRRRHSEGRHGSSDFIWSKELGDWALDDSRPDTDGHLIATGQPDVELCIWPDQQRADRCSVSDRIINQLKLSHYEPGKTFRIAVAGDHTLPNGQELFIKDNCLVNMCNITRELKQADVIIWPNSDVRYEALEFPRSQQIWIAYFLESPPNTFDKRLSRRYRGNHIFNWTASYRSDSDIVTPYAKFVPYLSSRTSAVRDIDTLYAQASEKIRTSISKKQTRVAWFVSNCHAKNNRSEVARQLAKFIPVDIYGRCGNLTCAKWDETQCLRQINRDYKFYLAFENSNNREYITEKLYQKAFGYNDEDHLVVPVVMGPPDHDYQRLAPPNSFIHVDNYKTVEDLAKYLHHLGSHDALYYSYLRWKTQGRFIDTKFLCRVCAMTHESHRNKLTRIVPNIKDWWREA